MASRSRFFATVIGKYAGLSNDNALFWISVVVTGFSSPSHCAATMGLASHALRIQRFCCFHTNRISLIIELIVGVHVVVGCDAIIQYML